MQPKTGKPKRELPDNVFELKTSYRFQRHAEVIELDAARRWKKEAEDKKKR